MGAEIDKKAVQPRAVRYNAKDQYFDPVRDKRMSELTTSQQDDARELWLIENLEAMVEYYKHHLRFLLDRVAGLRAELQQCRTGALQQAPIGVPELEAALRKGACPSELETGLLRHQAVRTEWLLSRSDEVQPRGVRHCE